MSASTTPNLFLVGAMKSGTSSLHDWIGQHPDVFMSTPKEPGYFVEQLTLGRGESWYRSLFENAGDATIIGESSTEYTKLPDYQGVIERIEAFSPNAKFIYVMRDPVERTLSHYWHNVRSRKKCERRDLMTALREDLSLINYSDYALQLVPYFQRFGPERVLAFTMEEMLGDRRKWLERIFQWGGVDADFAESVNFEHRHQTPQVVTQKVGWLARFRFNPVWNHVGPWVPSSVRRIGLQMSVRKAVDRAQVDQSEAIAYLQEEHRPRVVKLQTLLSREFPEWKTLGNVDPQDHDDRPTVAAEVVDDQR